MEERNEVKMVQVDSKCPKCNEGYMRPLQSIGMLMSYPPKFPHKCTLCDHQDTFLVNYPYIDYEKIK